VAAVTAYTNAAAHGESLQKGHHRLGKPEQLGIHPVFVAPESSPVIQIPGLAAGIHLGDVAARAERPVTLGVE